MASTISRLAISLLGLSGALAGRALTQLDRTIAVHDSDGNGLTNQEQLGLGSFGEQNEIAGGPVSVSTDFSLDNVLPDIDVTEDEGLSGDLDDGDFLGDLGDGDFLGDLGGGDFDLGDPLGLSKDEGGGGDDGDDSDDSSSSSSASATLDDSSAEADSDADGGSSATSSADVALDHTSDDSTDYSPVTIVVPVSDKDEYKKKSLKDLLATPSPPPPAAKFVLVSSPDTAPSDSATEVVLVPAGSPPVAPSPDSVVVEVPSGATPSEINDAVSAAAGR